MKRVWFSVVLVLTSLVVAAWASDFVTLQGERTIYTAQCEDGSWREGRCSGQMIAGNRYRYHASKERGEVVVQLVGSSVPARRFSNCVIRDGRNWTCPADDTVARSWTVQMKNGAPVAENSSTGPDRRISKWRWHVLNATAD